MLVNAYGPPWPGSAAFICPFRRGAIPRDFRVLPDKIFLVRHAESEGNVNSVGQGFGQ